MITSRSLNKRNTQHSRILIRWNEVIGKTERTQAEVGKR